MVKVKATVTFFTQMDSNFNSKTFAQIRYRDANTGKFISKEVREKQGLPDARKRPIPSVEAGRLFNAIASGKKSANSVAGILASYSTKVYALKLKSAQESFFQILDENFNLTDAQQKKFRRLAKRMSYEDFDSWYRQNTGLAQKVYNYGKDSDSQSEIVSDDALDESLETVERSLKKYYYGEWQIM